MRDHARSEFDVEGRAISDHMPDEPRARPRNQGGVPASNGTDPIAGLLNLGPSSARMLSDAGIRSVAALRKAGAVEAFRRVRKAVPRVSLNLLWALEGALTGRAWQDVAREDRLRLLLQLDDASPRR